MFQRMLSYLYVSMAVTGCGVADMPDIGGRHGEDGESIVPSAESSFDLAQCGFNPEKPTQVFATRRLTMLPQQMTLNTGGIFTWQVQTTLSGNSVVEDSLSRSVGTYSAQFSPAVQSEQASAMLAKYSAGFAADLLPVAERAKIGEIYPEWRGVFCSFQPAIEIQRGSTEKVSIALDKPLPLAPVLTADLSRLKSEIGVKRSWRQITAKVTDSTDPAVPNGSSWTGVVSSQPVASSVAIVGANGTKTQVVSELAVKMTYDFGGETANDAMGLPKSVIWYIDTGTKSFKLVQVDFGDGVLKNYLP